MGYREAALEGSGIVLQSIIGSTVTTCVVFLPLALLQGLTGQMFKPLGFTIIFCMVASLISAMTIVPLCYCFYRPQEKEESPVGALIRAMAEWLSQHHEGAAEEKENRPLHFCCIAGGCLLDGFSAAHGADGFPMIPVRSLSALKPVRV